MSLSQSGPLLAAALVLGASSAQAVEIEITNLTQGLYFTPLLVAAHPSSADLFEVGSAASSELQAMAEGGAISGLVGILDGLSANVVENPAGGLLAPGASTNATLDNVEMSNDTLSIVAMILPSNDGFVALDSWMIPSNAGSYVVYLNAYDAGTEANNELVVEGSGAPGTLGIPAAPGGDAGSGGSGAAGADNNSTVHIHRGTLGDLDLNGGISDLDPTVHRWLNPVARIIVTVE